MGRKPKLSPQQIIHAWKLIEQVEPHDTVAAITQRVAADALPSV